MARRPVDSELARSAPRQLANASDVACGETTLRASWGGSTWSYTRESAYPTSAPMMLPGREPLWKSLAPNIPLACWDSYTGKLTSWYKFQETYPLINYACSDLSARISDFWHFLVFRPRSFVAINTHHKMLVSCKLLDETLFLKHVLGTVHVADWDYESAAVKFMQYLRQGIGKFCLKGSRFEAINLDSLRIYQLLRHIIHMLVLCLLMGPFSKAVGSCNMFLKMKKHT
jgi:hypothetical protein